jgi:hypothetical protein
VSLTSGCRRVHARRRSAHEPVARRDVLAHRGRQRAVRGLIRQISHPDPTAPDLVLVGRSDAARCRADLLVAAPRFGEHVQLAVIRQDDVRLVTQEQPVGRIDAE